MGYKGVVSFVIYNRWGQQVFTTMDANRGWDGTFKGQSAQQGFIITTSDCVLEMVTLSNLKVM